MEAHRHRWSGVEFYLDHDRPMMRQTCECGAERRIRAFERYWDGRESLGAMAGHHTGFR